MLSDLDQRRAKLGWRREVEGEAGIVGQRCDRLHLGEHFGARLRLLGGRGAGAVARDIILQPCPLRVLSRAFISTSTSSSTFSIFFMVLFCSCWMKYTSRFHACD